MAAARVLVRSTTRPIRSSAEATSDAAPRMSSAGVTIAAMSVTAPGGVEAFPMLTLDVSAEPGHVPGPFRRMSCLFHLVDGGGDHGSAIRLENAARRSEARNDDGSPKHERRSSLPSPLPQNGGEHESAFGDRVAGRCRAPGSRRCLAGGAEGALSCRDS